MPLYTECLLTLQTAYLAWLAQTHQPWTWQTYGIRSAMIMEAYRYAIVHGA
jgi:hypothetical protein